MSADLHNQQRRLFAGVAILVILLIVVLVAVFRSIQHPGADPQIGYRSPAARLSYCAPQDTRLCVLSFGQVIGGDMQIHFKIPRTLYPEFSLIINRFGVESIYECKGKKGTFNAVTCTGPSQVPGEVLQFKVISIKQGTLLAEGKFSIIGIALSTPEFFFTDTPEPTPTVGPSETPTGTLPTPSYPNPSYPNPTSYP